MSLTRRFCFHPALPKNNLRSCFWIIFFALTVTPVFAQRPLGIDVSSYDGGSINWNTTRSGGVSFAWTKATEGLTVNDPDFTINEANAKAAGVLIGAYHFAHPDEHPGLSGADQEAAHFWSVAGNYITSSGNYLMPMLDFEVNVTNASPQYTASTLSAWANEWCLDIVKYAASNGVTVKPVVYTFVSYANGTGGYGPGLDSSITNWPLWMAQYPTSPNPQTGSPSGISPWTSWNFWQYYAPSAGSSTSHDEDVFNGTTNGLNAYVIGAYVAPYIVPLPFNNRVVDAGSNVSFSAVAEGTPPLTYKWTLNGATIPGATNSTLVISNAQPANSGAYALTVGNSGNTATSAARSLLVYPLQTVVFSDNFDSNTATNWTVNRSSTDTAVAFNYDYSALGIASAPHSTNGTTRGVQLKANLTLGVVAAISISPAGQSFAGDYRLHFDGWINVNGPFPAGGASSTEFMSAGLGTAGNRTEWNGSGSTADGYYFTADGDGGVSATSTTSGDYGAYIGTTFQNVGSGIYTAGSYDNANGYYTALFPTGQAAPALQQADYSQQTGSLAVGTLGLGWHDIIVSRRGSTVNWAVDGALFATINNATFTASNVFVGFWDPFASLTDNTNLSFGLVDNVRVEVPAVAPAFTLNPVSQTVARGTNVTFTAAAAGLPSPDYQWNFDGTNISGATNSSYTIASVTTNNAGIYSVTVTNLAGTATSSNATLALAAPHAAQFTGITVQSGNAVQLNFTGDAYWTYTVQTSTNLLAGGWINLTNVTSLSGTFSINAGSTTNTPQQFYRAVVSY